MGLESISSVNIFHRYLKPKKTLTPKGKRLLITINVIGSAGPIRLLVNEHELVSSVIVTALKSYARAGRLPVLGSDMDEFLLYSHNDESEALHPLDTIGSHGTRIFMLCKRPQTQNVSDDGTLSDVVTSSPKDGAGWRTWINKSLKLNISSH